MKFNMKDKPTEDEEDESLIGNVYRCKGGNKTRYWIIVAVNVNTVICLGIDEDGNITSSSNYGKHVFADFPWSRKRLGRVVDMPSLQFEVAWDDIR